MNEPWGISGPDFLRIYVVAFVFALLFAVAVRIMIRSGSAEGRAVSGAIGTGQLTLDELAHLAGGAERVVETAIARLIDRDKLRPSRKGTVRVVQGATAADPVDRAVVADVHRFHERSIGLLVDKVGRDVAVRSIGEGLARKGLLVGEAAARARWCVLPLAVLFVVGTARWTNGLAEGRPIGWLTLALVVSAVVGVVLYRRPVPERTYAGDRVLAQARRTKRSSNSVGDEAVLIGGMAGVVGVVALSGLAAHPDTELVMALEAQKQATVASSSGCSSGSTSSGSGGSSCSSGGGGGCGGGGCGG